MGEYWEKREAALLRGFNVSVASGSMFCALSVACSSLGLNLRSIVQDVPDRVLLLIYSGALVLILSAALLVMTSGFALYELRATRREISLRKEIATS